MLEYLVWISDNPYSFESFKIPKTQTCSTLIQGATGSQWLQDNTLLYSQTSMIIISDKFLYVLSKKSRQSQRNVNLVFI